MMAVESLSENLRQQTETLGQTRVFGFGLFPTSQDAENEIVTYNKEENTACYVIL